MPTINNKRPFWLPKAKPFESVEGDRSTEYHTHRWRQNRKRFLRHNPLCKRCNEKGLTTPATEIDHIIPMCEGSDFWNESNWQSLCHECHRKKTFADMRRRKLNNKNKAI